MFRVREQRTDNEAEQLLELGNATSTYVSQFAAPTSSKAAVASGGGADAGAQQQPHFLIHHSDGDDTPEALCSKMARALEKSLSNSERLRIPQHLVDTIYGRRRNVSSGNDNTTNPAHAVSVSDKKDGIVNEVPMESHSQEEEATSKAATAAAAADEADQIAIEPSDSDRMLASVLSTTEEEISTISSARISTATFSNFQQQQRHEQLSPENIFVTDLTHVLEDDEDVTSSVVYLGTTSTNTTVQAAVLEQVSQQAALEGLSQPKYDTEETEDDDLDSWLDSVIA
jgi:hypothetical protein